MYNLVNLINNIYLKYKFKHFIYFICYYKKNPILISVVYSNFNNIFSIIIKNCIFLIHTYFGNFNAFLNISFTISFCLSTYNIVKEF